MALVCLGTLLCSGCTERSPEENAAAGEGEPALADIVSVEARGEPGAYIFRVEVSSPDRGCDRYADWWEILSPEGELLYRRVLLHSHVTEQPFVRAGGPVELEPHDVVWIRAHMRPGGYGGKAARGSIETGFEPAELDAKFAARAAELPPLPEACGF